MYMQRTCKLNKKMRKMVRKKEKEKKEERKKNNNNKGRTRTKTTRRNKINVLTKFYETKNPQSCF